MNQQFYAKIKIHIKDIITKINNQTSINVFVKNTGGALWRKETFSGKRMIRLGVQLFDRNKNLIELNYARAFLNKALKKGEKDIIKIILPPLSDPGKYFIKFDMVSEGIDWFESGGSPVVWKNLSVIS